MLNFKSQISKIWQYQRKAFILFFSGFIEIDNLLLVFTFYNLKSFFFQL